MQTIDPFPGHYDAGDPFGSTKGRKYPHTGSDWNRQDQPESIVGKWVPAIAAGTVVFAGEEPTGGNGNCVCVDMHNGLYWAALHLDAVGVSVGDEIALGQGIGPVGNTGSNSIGAHLHITLSDSPKAYQGQGNKRDPWQFIQDHLTTLATDQAADTETEEEEMAHPWKLHYVTVNGINSELRLSNGSQTVKVEYNDGVDEPIIRRYMTEKEPSLTGGENLRIDYYHDLLNEPRQGQQPRTVQPNG